MKERVSAFNYMIKGLERIFQACKTREDFITLICLGKPLEKQHEEKHE